VPTAVHLVHLVCPCAVCAHLLHQVKTIILCGHYNCGAVRAALQLPHCTPGLVNCWISDIRECRNQAERELIDLDTEQQLARCVLDGRCWGAYTGICCRHACRCSVCTKVSGHQQPTAAALI
jgi:hypothetical protein